MDQEGILDDSWHTWLTENLNRGCDRQELASILRKNGFRSEAYRAALGGPVDEASAAVDYAGLSTVALTRQYAAQQIVTDKLQLYRIPNFLSAAECEGIIRLVSQRLRPSTLTIQSADLAYRNSKTCDLCFLGDPLLDEIDARVARSLGIQLSFSEGTQAQRYDVGEQFKQHTDFFEPGTPEYQQFAGARGNRTWTFMIYLNTVERGGGTRFFAIDQCFMPEQGMALVWNNLHPDGRVNHNTLHAGLPVERGHKIIITKWFREFGYGP